MPYYGRRPCHSRFAEWDEGWLEDWPLVPELQVEAPEPEPTGLVDHLGNDIVRLPEQIGFLTAGNAKPKGK